MKDCMNRIKDVARQVGQLVMDPARDFRTECCDEALDVPAKQLDAWDREADEMRCP